MLIALFTTLFLMSRGGEGLEIFNKEHQKRGADRRG